MKKRKYTWSDYEAEKRKLQLLHLSPKEYEQRLHALLERMKL